MRHFVVTTDQSFEQVIDACADPSRSGAWIDSAIRAAYVRMHELGWAHSIETRTTDGTLVGGLYGLSIGALFAGESMFHHATDASKAALVALARRVGDTGLIDTQWQTPHLASMGVDAVAARAISGTHPDARRRPSPYRLGLISRQNVDNTCRGARSGDR